MGGYFNLGDKTLSPKHDTDIPRIHGFYQPGGPNPCIRVRIRVVLAAPQSTRPRIEMQPQLNLIDR